MFCMCLREPPLPLMNGVYVLVFSGPEGALFQHSVEVPLLKSELLKDLK